ncbi:MAG: hypothetical protein CL930_15570 [Deltaproteobacteria bacterium]|nr:hypothetical protein [Deltaproteobacteria bacterium]
MTWVNQIQILNLIYTSSCIALGLMGSWCMLAFALDRFGRKPLTAQTFDALIVLGCAVRPGGTASAALHRRTMHAVDLWHQGLAPRIIMTGGVGRHAPAESLVSAAIAEEHGIPRDSILVEDQSKNTIENAHFAATVHNDASTWSVLVVTDGYHCWRSKRIFSRYFCTVTATGSTPGTRLRVKGALREVISILFMLIR